MIKFNKHHVTNGILKAKIHYSLDNRTDNRKCVTLYAKDYDRVLGQIFTNEYVNDTDSMTDYFDQGRVTLFEDHDLYQAARNRATFKPKPKKLVLDQDFEIAFNNFLKACQNVIDLHYQDHPSSPILSVTKGRKYLRIIKKDYPDHTGGSVYGFVDISNGLVMRPNGWKTPKPGSCGNIYNDDHGASQAGEYSITRQLRSV